MPVMFAKDRVNKGEIRPEDVPYMQRGGSWDNADIKGAKKMKWNEIDKKNEDRVASSQKIDWTGNQARRGPAQASKKTENKPETKKLFGLWWKTLTLVNGVCRSFSDSSFALVIPLFLKSY